MKVGPSHLIIEYEAVKARPLRAREAINGSASLLDTVFERIDRHRKVKEERERVSVRVREVSIVIVIVVAAGVV